MNLNEVENCLRGKFRNLADLLWKIGKNSPNSSGEAEQLLWDWCEFYTKYDTNCFEFSLFEHSVSKVILANLNENFKFDAQIPNKLLCKFGRMSFGKEFSEILRNSLAEVIIERIYSERNLESVDFHSLIHAACHFLDDSRVEIDVEQKLNGVVSLIAEERLFTRFSKRLLDENCNWSFGKFQTDFQEKLEGKSSEMEILRKIYSYCGQILEKLKPEVYSSSKIFKFFKLPKKFCPAMELLEKYKNLTSREVVGQLICRDDDILMVFMLLVLLNYNHCPKIAYFCLNPFELWLDLCSLIGYDHRVFIDWLSSESLSVAFLLKYLKLIGANLETFMEHADNMAQFEIHTVAVAENKCDVPELENYVIVKGSQNVAGCRMAFAAKFCKSAETLEKSEPLTIRRHENVYGSAVEMLGRLKSSLENLAKSNLLQFNTEPLIRALRSCIV